MSIEDKNQAILLKEIAESLTQASGGARQLIHHLRHPGFIVISEALELTKEATMTMTKFQAVRTIAI